MMEARPVRLPAGRTWKDKILDYEIETDLRITLKDVVDLDLKR